MINKRVATVLLTMIMATSGVVSASAASAVELTATESQAVISLLLTTEQQERIAFIMQDRSLEELSTEEQEHLGQILQEVGKTMEKKDDIIL